jgi:hypothetical protein
MAATLIGRTPGLRVVNTALLVLAGSLIIAGACSFGPGAPRVDTATIWTDTVQRGDLPIERRGAGQLVEADDGRLYAQVRVPESQSLDLELGHEAVVDLRVATAPARVTELGDRITQGVRVVRLDFTGEVPDQALPGMSIDATIQVEVVPDVLFVGKPAYGQANARIALFKLTEDGRFAERVEVHAGRGSVNLIEILEGLEEGDRVILSDMSRFDVVDRVALR